MFSGIQRKIRGNKQKMKFFISILLGIFLMTYAVEGTYRLQPAFSISVSPDLSKNPTALKSIAESILQRSSNVPVEVEGGQPIEIIPNSFIVQLKSPEVGALEDTVGTMTADLTAAGGNVTAVYDQFGMFNVQFDVPEAGAASIAATGGSKTVRSSLWRPIPQLRLSSMTLSLVYNSRCYRTTRIEWMRT